MSFALVSGVLAGTQIGLGFLSSSRAKKQARKAKKAGRIEAAHQIRLGRQLKGRQRAAFSAGNVLVGEGTPLDILAQTDADAMRNAIRAAEGFGQQAEDFTSAGRASLTAGLLNAGGTLLSGFTPRTLPPGFFP
jgi:hypothetical protein